MYICIHYIGIKMYVCIYVNRNKDEVSRDRLGEADLVVFGGPREPFTTVEFEELKVCI
jgi:hypothetical protein